jgi:hypothetical protein
MQCTFPQSKFSYQVEAGSLLSIGSNKHETKTVIVNNIPVSVGYASTLKFKYPSIRVRTSINYKISKIFEGGIESGITVRYNEPAYTEQHLFAFPILSKFQFNILRIASNYQVVTDLGIGYSLMKIANQGVDEKGGLIYNGGLALSTISNSNIDWRLVFGFEQQHEKLFFHFNRPEPGIIVKRLRNQLYLSIGFILK